MQIVHIFLKLKCCDFFVRDILKEIWHSLNYITITMISCIDEIMNLKSKTFIRIKIVINIEIINKHPIKNIKFCNLLYFNNTLRSS